MNPRVKEVVPDTDYTLIITFENQEKKRFDVKPFLDGGIFKELRNKEKFNATHPCLGTVQWSGGQDLCPDTLYENRVPVK
jgi:hypothetical protein